ELLAVVPPPMPPLLELLVEPLVELVELEVDDEGTQLPVWQVPPGHAVPSGATGLEQTPVIGAQVPARWQGDEAWQTMGLEPTQKPPMHWSVWVQRLPSSQVVPSALAGLEQRPLWGSQVPATWQPSSAVHTFGLVPVQTPAW